MNDDKPGLENDMPALIECVTKIIPKTIDLCNGLNDKAECVELDVIYLHDFKHEFEGGYVEMMALVLNEDARDFVWTPENEQSKSARKIIVKHCKY